MISALVLAAGRSVRMGCSKLLLPWGNTTVIGKVINSIQDAGLTDIHVVTGGYHTELEEFITQFGVDVHFNPDYVNGEMLSSVKVGLRYLSERSEAALIVLGDQPQIEKEVVRVIVDHYLTSRIKIIVPSYQMHRGHPWLIDRSIWKEVLNLSLDKTLRDFLNLKHNDIGYVLVNTPSVILDLDTPVDYQKYHP